MELASNDTSDITYPVEPLTEVTKPIDIQRIWKVALDDEEVIAGIKQSDETFFGLCKSEGENPWNGIIAGLISEREVDMATAALKRDSLVSTQLVGLLDYNTIQGTYIRFDGKNKATMGKFTAELINPEVDEYIPAIAEKLDIIETEPQQTNNQATIADNSRFQDVRNSAKGINPDIMPNHAKL